jgi:hypothetical protein
MSVSDAASFAVDVVPLVHKAVTFSSGVQAWRLNVDWQIHV